LTNAAPAANSTAPVVMPVAPPAKKGEGQWPPTQWANRARGPAHPANSNATNPINTQMVAEAISARRLT
jgi:hypothetical protein